MSNSFCAGAKEKLPESHRVTPHFCVTFWDPVPAASVTFTLDLLCPYVTRKWSIGKDDFFRSQQ